MGSFGRFRICDAVHFRYVHITERDGISISSDVVGKVRAGKLDVETCLRHPGGRGSTYFNLT
jgi:hypothetical protein